VNRVFLPHGSAIEREGCALVRWVAPGGATVASVDEDGVRLELAGVHDTPVIVGGPIEHHAVLGPVQTIRAVPRGGEVPVVVAHVGAVDWREPSHVPAIDAPARLPAGVGTALLNVLALGGKTLRYAGPYPTASLWTSLGECFRREGSEDDFTRGGLERALAGDRSEVPIDLVPAPFERVQVAPRIVVHLRDGVERAWLGGVAWSSGGARRLVRGDDEVRLELWIAGAPWAEVAALAPDGVLVRGPRALPPIVSGVLGKRFPPALLAALVELVTVEQPPLLAGAMREVIHELPVMWGDPGADAARAIAGVLVVHAGIWERLGGGPMATLAMHLADALAMPLAQLAQQRLETIPVGTQVH
jgi:hypothetical protein